MWYLILGLLSGIYLLTSIVLPSMVGGFIGTYILRPVIWILFGLTVYLIARNDGLKILNFNKVRRWEILKSPFQAAILIASFQIALTLIAGIFFGFGNSPYSFAPLAIITNLIFVFSALIGIEIARSYFVKIGTKSRRKITLIIALISILFMFFMLKPSDFTPLYTNDPALILQFFGEKIIPLLAMSLFVTYIAYLGGALAAIGYMGVLQGFQWLSPVLPNLDWTVASLIGTLAPAIGFLIIQNNIQLSLKKPSRGRRKRKAKGDPAISWTAIAAIGVVLIFFSSGYLGAQPTIIYSGSMRGEIDVGDIVLIADVEMEDIKVGEYSPLKGVTVKEGLGCCGAIAILAIKKKKGKLITSPTMETMLELDDELVIIGTREQLKAVGGAT